MHVINLVDVEVHKMNLLLAAREKMVMDEVRRFNKLVSMNIRCGPCILKKENKNNIQFSHFMQLFRY